MNTQETFTLEELCALTDFPKRTIRYYIQQGLVEKPEGSTRGSRYLQSHLEQLLLIRKWQKAGLNLERIRELLRDDGEMPPLPRPKPGDIHVESHMFLAEGITLCIDPQKSSLTPEQTRALARGILSLLEHITSKETEHA